MARIRTSPTTQPRNGATVRWQPDALLGRLLLVSALFLTVPACGALAAGFERGSVRLEQEEFGYLLLEPESTQEGETYPLVLFLHGAGERGTDNGRQARHLPERMASATNRERYPCFLLAPQCRKGSTWMDEAWRDWVPGEPWPTPTADARAAVKALLEVVGRHPIDRDRIYLTGLSLGGFGSWDLAARYPDWWAGVVPVCGGGMPDLAHRWVGQPIWAWHGERDRIVPPRFSRDLVDAVRALGGRVQYTECEGVGHDAWNPAYGPDGALDWLFRQRRDPQSKPAGLAALLGDRVPLREGDVIAFLGDSITQAGAKPDGYVDQIATALKEGREALDLEVVGAGISGHKVPDLLKRYQADVIDRGATVVFVYIGINDVWHSKKDRGTPLQAYESGLAELVAGLRESGALVVLATPTTIGEKSDGSNELDGMLEEYADASRRVARQADLELCDLRRDMIDFLRLFNPEGLEKGILTTDGVHLNAAGNRFVADRAARSIAAALVRDRSAK